MQEESVENNKIHEIRLIVAGTRTFDDYVLMKEKLDRIIPAVRRLCWYVCSSHARSQESSFAVSLTIMSFVIVVPSCG